MKKWENPKIECIGISLTEGGVSPLVEFDGGFYVYCTGCSWTGFYTNTNDIPNNCKTENCTGTVRATCNLACRPS